MSLGNYATMIEPSLSIYFENDNYPVLSSLNYDPGLK